MPCVLNFEIDTPEISKFRGCQSEQNILRQNATEEIQ